MMKILYWHPTAGHCLSYRGGVILIEDLNPQIKTKWRMTPWERFRTGWRLMLTAFQ